MHGQQLDRRDTDGLQVRDRVLVGEARVAAPQLLRHVRGELREALHVRLVHDDVAQREERGAHLAPVEGLGLDDLGGPGRDRDGADVRDLPGVRLDEQAVLVERVRAARRAVRTHGVPLTIHELGALRLPDAAWHAGHLDGAGDGAVRIHEAEGHRRSVR